MSDFFIKKAYSVFIKKKARKEIMALGVLLILFVGMSVISVLGLIIMYLVKNESIKKVVFHGMAVWGMIIAVISATSLPQNDTIQQVIAWMIGFLSVAGIIVHVRAKDHKQKVIAYSLVSVSVIAGMAKLFLL